MSARAMMLVGLLLALAAPRAGAVFWTAPDPAVSGQSTAVVFSAWSYGGQPTVDVQVEDGRIVLVLSDLCAPDVCFSARVPAIAQATLPSLPPGSYAVEVVEQDGDEEPLALAALQVHDTPVAASVPPAEGFWSPVGQPGSGLFLERRGELLAVSTYSYRDAQGGVPGWWLGSAGFHGDSALLLVHSFLDGDCLACSDHRPAEGPLAPTGLRLRFESARRAWLDIAEPGREARAVPIVSLPFGATYLPHALTDTVDDEFGPLPLPDLSGVWVLGVHGDAQDMRYEKLYFDHVALLEDGSVRFETQGQPGSTLTCRSATDALPAGCSLADAVSGGPVPFLLPLHRGQLFFALGDIGEDRMHGVLEVDGGSVPVQAFRFAPPDEVGATQNSR